MPLKKHPKLNPFTPFAVLVVLLFIAGFVLGSFFLAPSTGQASGSAEIIRPVGSDNSSDKVVRNNLFWWDEYVVFADELPSAPDGTSKSLESFYPYAKNSTNPFTKQEAAQKMIAAKNSGTPIFIVCAHYEATVQNPNPEVACVEILDYLVQQITEDLKKGDYPS